MAFNLGYFSSFPYLPRRKINEDPLHVNPLHTNSIPTKGLYSSFPVPVLQGAHDIVCFYFSSLDNKKESTPQKEKWNNERYREDCVRALELNRVIIALSGSVRSSGRSRYLDGWCMEEVVIFSINETGADTWGVKWKTGSEGREAQGRHFVIFVCYFMSLFSCMDIYDMMCVIRGDMIF